MICTEIQAVRAFPISSCEGVVTFYYVPPDTLPEEVLVQLQDRHGNQCIITPTVIDAITPNYTCTFDLSQAPANFMSQSGQYLLRLLNSEYCFAPIVPNVCNNSETDTYETIQFSFTTPQFDEWTIIL